MGRTTVRKSRMAAAVVAVIVAGTASAHGPAASVSPNTSSNAPFVTVESLRALLDGVQYEAAERGARQLLADRQAAGPPDTLVARALDLQVEACGALGARTARNPTR